MLRRTLTGNIELALTDTPVILLHGARQTGKTTLAHSLARDGGTSRYVTLDDPAALAAALQNPRGFLEGLRGRNAPMTKAGGAARTGPAVLDEVQRAPDLFPVMKLLVDQNRRPGMFLITGSANVLLLPKLSESLAGRMEIATLWPLSQGEIEGVRETFIDAAFSAKFANRLPNTRKSDDLTARLLRGGYPDAFRRADARRRAWFDGYLTTILQRDVRDLANIDGLTLMPRLLALLASRAGGLLNFADLSRSMSIPQSTLKRYMTLLQTVFLIYPLQPWSTNVGLRLVKSPKMYLNDTGLLSYLLGLDKKRLARDPAIKGLLLENFVVMELVKQAGWSKTKPSAWFYCTSAGREVDMVLEGPSGDVVGIEVKASASVTGDDLKGLRSLAEAAGKKFLRGIVLYTGTEVVPFDKHTHAVPVETLGQGA
jgi:hypothetical protein